MPVGWDIHEELYECNSILAQGAVKVRLFSVPPKKTSRREDGIIRP
jgi:hypothetical protein